MNNEILMKHKLDELTKNPKYIKVTSLVNKFSDEAIKRREENNMKAKEQLLVKFEEMKKEYDIKSKEEIDKTVAIQHQQIRNEYQRMFKDEKKKLELKYKQRSSSQRNSLSPRANTKLSTQLDVSDDHNNYLNTSNNKPKDD